MIRVTRSYANHTYFMIRVYAKLWRESKSTASYMSLSMNRYDDYFKL